MKKTALELIKYRDRGEFEIHDDGSPEPISRPAAMFCYDSTQLGD